MITSRSVKLLVVGIMVLQGLQEARGEAMASDCDHAGQDSASQVSLTVSGVDSLKGTYCPMEITLFCEGVNLTLLIWKINGIDVNRNPFVADDVPKSVKIPRYNLTITLNNISRAKNNSSIANFNSSLTVNLLSFYNEGVFELSCGDIREEASLSVDINIILAIPPAPEILVVRASYQNKSLISLEITWIKAATECPESIGYIVSVDDHPVLNMPHVACDEICYASVTQKEFLIEENQTILKVTALNRFSGSKITTDYPMNIGTQNEYFVSSLFYNGHETVGWCNITGIVGTDQCLVEYSTDPVSSVNLTTNSLFSLPYLAYCRQYYFNFSVALQNGLFIVETVEYTLESNTLTTSPEGALLAISIILGCIVITFIYIGYIVCKLRGGLTNSEVSRPKCYLTAFCVLVAAVMFIVFFISWIGVFFNGLCRENWMVIRYAMLVCCLFLAAGGLLIAFGIVIIHFIYVRCSGIRNPKGEESKEMLSADNEDEFDGHQRSPYNNYITDKMCVN